MYILCRDIAQTKYQGTGTQIIRCKGKLKNKTTYNFPFGYLFVKYSVKTILITSYDDVCEMLYPVLE